MSDMHLQKESPCKSKPSVFVKLARVLAKSKPYVFVQLARVLAKSKPSVFVQLACAGWCCLMKVCFAKARVKREPHIKQKDNKEGV